MQKNKRISNSSGVAFGSSTSRGLAANANQNDKSTLNSRKQTNWSNCSNYSTNQDNILSKLDVSSITQKDQDNTTNASSIDTEHLNLALQKRQEAEKEQQEAAEAIKAEKQAEEERWKTLVRETVEAHTKELSKGEAEKALETEKVVKAALEKQALENEREQQQKIEELKEALEKQKQQEIEEALQTQAEAAAKQKEQTEKAVLIGYILQKLNKSVLARDKKEAFNNLKSDSSIDDFIIIPLITQYIYTQQSDDEKSIVSYDSND